MTEEVTTTQEVAPPAQTPAGKTYTQQDVDSIMDNVRKVTAAKIIADTKAQQEAAELSDLQKAQRELETERTARQQAEATATRSTRTTELLRKVKPTEHVPALYLEHVVSEWNDGDWDADKAFGKAREMWDAERGGVTASTNVTKAVPASMKSGTPITESPRDFSRMTNQQIKERAFEMANDRKEGPHKAKQYLSDASQFRASGGRFADEK